MRSALLIFAIFHLHSCTLQNQNDSLNSKTAAEISYEKFFKRNRESIENIEGIWYEYAVGSLYKDRILLQRIREPNRATWIIIKDKNSNTYNVLNANGKDNYYDASFSPTSKKDLFAFDCIIKDTQARISSAAKVVDLNQLEMEYNAPKSLISENYSEIDGDLILHWKIEWIKSFPRN